MARVKTPCPISREEFLAEAKDVAVSIEGTPIVAMAKEFSTGSFGWNANGKVRVKVGDKTLTVQVGINLTVLGSKPEGK